MKRWLPTALFALLAFPAIASAQTEEGLAGPPSTVSTSAASDSDLESDPESVDPEDGFQLMNLRMLKELSGRPRAVWESLEPYRRVSDATLNWPEIRKDWKAIARQGAIGEAGGFLNFTLALFLKELAVVAVTGDRTRINEFFDGLLTTDFYAHYGLFVAGARIGQVAYAGLLQRYVKPRFVSGLLKTNMVLAAGIALPQIYNGRFEGKAFAVSVASLGLSSVAIEAASAGVKGLMSLKKASSEGKLATLGKQFSTRFGGVAKFGGWVFTAAKLAVILFIAEEAEGLANDWLGVRDARAELTAATKAFAKALADPKATPESVKAATDEYHAIWSRYRNYLFRRLHLEEARFATEVEDLARDAKLSVDLRDGMLDRIPGHKALLEHTRKTYGSVENYVNSATRPAEEAFKKSIGEALTNYEARREALFNDLYEKGLRDTPLLGDLAGDWLSDGGAQDTLLDAVGSASTNRIESYDDENEILDAARAALKSRGRTDLSNALGETRNLVTEIRAADKRLYTGEPAPAPTTGHDRPLGQ